MTLEITPQLIQRISAILGAEGRNYHNHIRFDVHASEPGRQLTLEIYPSVPLGPAEGTLISVFTPNSNLQLQQCSGVVISELMGEVTFVAESSGKISGLIVEKEGACSMYANVDRGLLSGDFTQLGPEVMMSSVALSLTELILPEDEEAPGE